MFVNEAQIKARETKDLKDRQAKRTRAKAKASFASTSIFNMLAVPMKHMCDAMFNDQ